MTSNLLTLLKVNIRETLDKRKFKNNKKQQTFLVYIFLMALLFLGLSTFYSVIYAMNFKTAGMVDYIYTLSLLFFGATTFVTFTSSISKMQTIFLGSDYDILTSLPIKKKDIVLSKIFNLYIVELIIALVILVPNGIVSTVMTTNPLYLIIIPLAFVAPAFPMLVALFITALLELLIKNQKVKTIIGTAAAFSFFIVIFVFSFMSGFKSGENSQASMFMTVGNAAHYINPSLFFLEWTFEGNPLWSLVYVGSNLALLIIVLSIVTIAFNNIHNNMVITKLSSQNKTRSKTKNVVIRTQAKEIRHMTINNFFRSKNSIMQCGIGLIMTLMFSIVLAILAKTGAITSTNPETGEPVNLLLNLKPYIFAVTIFFSFFIGIMPPSATAVSLEGMNFYALKSLPLDFKVYLREKLLFSFFVALIPSLTSAIILTIFVEQTVFSIIISLIFPFVFSFFISAYTLIINAAFPYLTWKEEIEVYKYHKSTLITVFTDMGISIATIVVTIVLAIINPYLSGILMTVLFLILSIVLYIILMKVSAKKLEKLEVSD